MQVGARVRWGKCMEPDLTAHVSPPQYKYDPNTADWSREMRGKTLLSGVALMEYMILFTGRDAPKAQVIDLCVLH